MANDKPTRLRRAPIGGTSDSFDHASGLPRRSSLGVPISTVSTPPLPVERGLVHGTSNPGNEQSLAPYRDVSEGETTRPGEAPRTSAPPFALHTR